MMTSISGPTAEVVPTCVFFDTGTQAWSSEGCVYWRSDNTTGAVSCNCSHLTRFSAQQRMSVLSESKLFLDVTKSFSQVGRNF